MKRLALTLCGLLVTAGAFASPLPEYEPNVQAAFPHLRYADGARSLNDRCPVRKNKLSRRVDPLYVNGKPLSFCCTPCVEIFGKDPERYLKELGVSVACPVERGRRAVLTWQNRARIGHDLYYFSSTKARDRFLADPLRWSGRLTDPVSDVRFHPTSSSPKTSYDGRAYYFASADSRATFLRHPSVYANPKRVVHPEPN